MNKTLSTQKNVSITDDAEEKLDKPLPEQSVLTTLRQGQHYCERCGLPCDGPYWYYTKDPRWRYQHNWHSQEVRQAAALAGIKIGEWCHLSKKLMAQRREETYLTIGELERSQLDKPVVPALSNHEEIEQRLAWIEKSRALEQEAKGGG